LQKRQPSLVILLLIVMAYAFPKSLPSNFGFTVGLRVGAPDAEPCNCEMGQA
jgi:hypothetical protein